MKPKKLSKENAEWLAQFGSTPNQAINNIRVTLGLPKGSLKDLSTGNKGCLEGYPKVTQNAIQHAEHTINQSVADLKSKFNTILLKINNRLQTLETKQNDMQTDFNERVNKYLSHMVKSQIESLQETIIKKLRQELKQQ